MNIRPLAFAFAVLSLIAVSTGCKKNQPAKTFLITQLGNSTNTTNYTYDAQGKLTRLYGPTSSIDLFYSGDKLIRRTSTLSGSLNEIDSVYYDASGRIFSVVAYEQPANTKTKTTVFAFNADNTVNTATVHYENPATDDVLFEFTYTDGKLAQRTKSLKIGGNYKLANKLEYTAYDTRVNPLASFFRKYLSDVVEAFIYYSAYPNNFTIAKSTDYDTTTGAVTNVTPVTATYTYNSDNLPAKMYITEGSATDSLTYQYTQQ